MGHMAHIAGNRKTNRVLAKKPEGKRQHGRPRCRWEDNTTMVKVNQSHYRPKVPRGFQEGKVPRSCENGPGWW